MKVALTGYAHSGRSTIFRCLCDSFTETSVDKGRLKVKVGVSKVVDRRLDLVREIYSSAKETYGEIHFSDFDYVQTGSERKGFDEQMIAQMKMADALIYVARGFVNESVHYRFDPINPLRDIQELESDMIISDLSSAENRLSRIKSDLDKGKKELQTEYDLVSRIKGLLDQERPLRLEKFYENQEKLIRGFGFLTQKKGIVLINVDDDGNFPGDMNAVRQWADERGLNVMILRGKLQSEIRELDEEDREIFIKEMGLEEAAWDKFIREIFNTLGLIQFFTGSEPESRAWIIKNGTSAYDAAGEVHTDFQKKFIRAEVIGYGDLDKHRNIKACKEAGVFRQEKKEYIVQDGDLIFFRHN